VDDGRATDFVIEKIFKHPKYTGTAYYDIAVLQIARVKLTAFLRPVCLPDSSKFELHRYDDKTATLIGWGSNDVTGSTSASLKRTILTIYDYA
jgi:hypothetical protein